MRVFIVHLIGICAILSVKADGEQQEIPPQDLKPGQFPLQQPGSFPPAWKPVLSFLTPPPLFANFTNKPLNDIVNLIIGQGIKFVGRMDRNLCSDIVNQMNAMFVNYLNYLQKVEEKASSCVTDDMKSLPEDAIKEVTSCLPSLSDLQRKGAAAKENFNALVETLSAVDQEVSALTDDAQKLSKIVDTEWSTVFDFYVEQADKIFQGLQKVHECMTNKRSAIKSKMDSYLKSLKTCQQQ